MFIAAPATSLLSGVIEGPTIELGVHVDNWREIEAVRDRRPGGSAIRGRGISLLFKRRNSTSMP
jgi:hypothetical protein